jgi:hypothetical protein
MTRLDEFLQAAWPVLAILGVILAVWLTRRYLFARDCWRCGFQLGKASHRSKPLLGFIKMVQCRRCGANSVQLS